MSSYRPIFAPATTRERRDNFEDYWNYSDPRSLDRKTLVVTFLYKFAPTRVGRHFGRLGRHPDHGKLEVDDREDQPLPPLRGVLP